jgi:hypothetical protein
MTALHGSLREVVDHPLQRRLLALFLDVATDGPTVHEGNEAKKGVDEVLSTRWEVGERCGGHEETSWRRWQ